MAGLNSTLISRAAELSVGSAATKKNSTPQINTGEEMKKWVRCKANTSELVRINDLEV